MNDKRQSLLDKYNFLKSRKSSLIGSGFDCFDGWIPLLERTFDSISAQEKNNDFFVTEVKEKYGELRIYTHGGNKEISNIIYEAERESRTICEICGKPGKTRIQVFFEGKYIVEDVIRDNNIRKFGLYFTVCEKHKQKLATMSIMNMMKKK